MRRHSIRLGPGLAAAALPAACSYGLDQMLSAWQPDLPAGPALRLLMFALPAVG